MKIILLKWLPASGKSEFCRKFLKENKGAVRVNKDTIREMLHFSKRSREREQVVISVRDSIIRWLVREKTPYILVDDTNFSKDHEETISTIAMDNWYEFEVVFLNTWPKTCLLRNSRRAKKVPDVAINTMHKRALEKWYEFVEEETETYTEDQSLPSAVLVDVDGTLAKMHNRSPYERDKVWEDLLKVNTHRVVRLLKESGWDVVVFTWRDWSCRKETIERLDKYKVPYDHFDMRQEWDQRPDWVVKKEMLDKVKWKYRIQLAIDDRTQMVDFYRRIWIECRQVDHWNF